ncbi:hypothetical protein AWH62_10795 [Maricaulis sp. W15]|uniref:DUF6456 domain-containing protein n=1 Tax=Maricaulis sp. W15 TaxID=1772333 RepID=UPI00096908DE|nr:DUF6456 domain-containing protein [Maricaulis sp. W15]OLF72314.1 hypothetical protein AWH62_10795 [Maricaulis sp. W15]
MSAPRWMRALARPGARMLPPGEIEARAVVLPKGDRRRRPTTYLSASRFEEAMRCGWLARRENGLGLSADGQAALKAGTRGEDPDPAARHREMEDRSLITPDGSLRTARANRREGPLGPWLDGLEPHQRQAGERFISDYHQSTLMSPVTRNWSPTAQRRSEGRRKGPEDAAVSALAAKDRVMDALDALGPTFARVIEAALVHEDSAAALERRFGWAARSGRTVLGLALTRLAEIYRLV